MIRKEFSILISAIFIVMLISSTTVHSVQVSGADNQDFLYTVSVNPPLVRVQQGEFGTFDVKVQRGSDVGPIFIDLSLTGDSTVPSSAVTFNPPTLNFEQGQTAVNSTMKINTHELDIASFRIRVQAATHTPVGSDQAVSNPAALIVTKSLKGSDSVSSARADVSALQTEGGRLLPEAATTQLNHAPIAKAGQDQFISEDERGILDASASTDPDKDALSYSWEQLVPRQPTIKLATDYSSSKASFIAPDVDRDTFFRFKLLVQDGKGGQAVDSINIMVKNIAVAESPAPKQEEHQQPESQTPSTETGKAPIEMPAATKNHSPTAQNLQTMSAAEGNPLSFFLKGSDPDNDDTISYVIVTNPSHGTIAGFDKATGSLTYVPNTDFVQDMLSFKVVDSNGAESNVGLIVIRANTAKLSTPSSPASPSADSSANTTSNAPSSSSSPTSPPSSTTPQVGENVTGSTQSANASGARAENNTTPNELTALTSFSASALVAATSEVYSFVKKWDGSETGLVFNKPHDLDIDGSGNVYVVDTDNNRVVKFSSTGKFIPTTGFSGLLKPQGISINKVTGAIYVVDTGHNSIKKFSSTGTLCGTCVFGTSGQGQVNTPVDVGIDGQGNVYVSDANNHRMVKYDSNGVFMFKFGTTGSAAGKVVGPHSIAIDKSGGAGGSDKVYVVDTASSQRRVLAYDASNGAWIPSLSFDGGNGGQRFSMPHGIAIDSDHSAFVSDFGAKNMRKLTSAGVSLTAFGQPGRADGQFNGPDGVTVNATGLVFVTDTVNNNVQIFAKDTIPPTVLSTEPADGAIDVPVDVVINATFSKAVDASSVNTNTFKLSTGDGLTQVTGTVFLSADGKIASFTPTSPLTTSPSYTATITTGVKDKVGNFLAADYVWSFSMPPQIQIAFDSTPPTKWGFELAFSGTAFSAHQGDTISIDFGDGIGPTETTPVLPGGEFTATHTYASSAMSPSPEKTVVAKLLNSQGVERATSEPLLVTLEKHDSKVLLDLIPSPQCTSCFFAVSGNLTDLDTATKTGIPGKTITFSGSGVPPSLSSVQTQGIKFTGDLTLIADPNDAAKGVAILLKTGSKVVLPPPTRGAAWILSDISGNPKYTLLLGNGTTLGPFDAQPGETNADFADGDGNGLREITITSGSVTLTMIITRDVDIDPSDFISVDLSSNSIGQPGVYALIEARNSSFVSRGLTQDAAANGLAVSASFAGDMAYKGASSTTSGTDRSYDIIPGFNGGGVTNGGGAAVWSTMYVNTTQAGAATLVPTSTCSGENPVFFGGRMMAGGKCTKFAYNDVCATVVGVVATPSTLRNSTGDRDKDGICDSWEATTNDASGNAFITCPTYASVAVNSVTKKIASGTIKAVDPAKCADTTGAVKYNLCMQDDFGQTAKRACPRINHKDIYLEIDAQTGQALSTTAIQRVVKAFASAPGFTGAGLGGSDAFGNTGGITLHVDVDETNLPNIKAPKFCVWTDNNVLGSADCSSTNKDDDFVSVKDRHFGTPTEYVNLDPAQRTTNTKTLLAQKHFAYHYGLSIHSYGGACVLPTGLSSGVAEILGNDIVISLGCGFGVPQSITGVGTVDEQAGTLMHELGHNLNLYHGGAAGGGTDATSVNLNCKPNYLSVMNYGRQMPSAIFDQASWEAGFNYGPGTFGGTTGTQTALDYSRYGSPTKVIPVGYSGPTMNDLGEGALSESTGVVGSDSRPNWVIYGNPLAAVGGTAKKSATGPINWNGDTDTTDLALAQDVNKLITNAGLSFPGCASDTPTQTLKSLNDWANLNLIILPDTESQRGQTQAPSQPWNEREITPAIIQALNAEAGQVQFIPPPNLDGSSVFNGGQTVPLKFRLKDNSGAFDRNEVVTLVAKKDTAPFTLQEKGPFVYDLAQEQYKYEWVTPQNSAGTWTLKYVANYKSVDPLKPETVIPGTNPAAVAGGYTLKVTLNK